MAAPVADAGRVPWGVPLRMTHAAGNTAQDTSAIDIPARCPLMSCPGASRSSGTCSASPANKRLRNLLSTVWSNPGCVRSSDRAYFQSMRARTVSAAWRPERSSANWKSVMRASRQGAPAGRPRLGNRSARCRARADPPGRKLSDHCAAMLMRRRMSQVAGTGARRATHARYRRSSKAMRWRRWSRSSTA